MPWDSTSYFNTLNGISHFKPTASNIYMPETLFFHLFYSFDNIYWSKDILYKGVWSIAPKREIKFCICWPHMTLNSLTTRGKPTNSNGSDKKSFIHTDLLLLLDIGLECSRQKTSNTRGRHQGAPLRARALFPLSFFFTALTSATCNWTNERRRDRRHREAIQRYRVSPRRPPGGAKRRKVHWNAVLEANDATVVHRRPVTNTVDEQRRTEPLPWFTDRKRDGGRNSTETTLEN